jgi:hypothetical protein
MLRTNFNRLLALCLALLLIASCVGTPVFADLNNPFLGLWKATAGDGSGNWVSVEFNSDGTSITTLVQDGNDPLVLPGSYTYDGGDTLVMNGEDTITLRADRTSFDALLGGVVPTIFYKVDTSDTFNLADLSNPFIGQWQSDIPSAGMTLVFDYKTDGTFDYVIPELPAAYGPNSGSGGYVVFGNMMISYLDFEGASAYTFEVMDNNTINVTELEPDENGNLVAGNTAPFMRVEGSVVNTADLPLQLDNPFLGQWQSDIPSAGMTLIFDYKTNGTFDYELVGVPAEYGGVGSGCYIVYGGIMVSYLDFEGIASYTFALVDEDTINVTELEPDEDGNLVAGNTAPFTRVGSADDNPSKDEGKSTNSGNNSDGNDSFTTTSGGSSTSTTPATVSVADDAVSLDSTQSGGDTAETGDVTIIEADGIVPGGAMEPVGDRDGSASSTGSAYGDGSDADLTITEGGVPLGELPNTGGPSSPIWLWLGSGALLLLAAGKKITARSSIEQ